MAISTNRPTSPHLQVYKLPLTGIISITHRITGVLLSAGLILTTYIMSALADGADSYATMQTIINLWLFKGVCGGFIYALFFHLCHGVRHLIWDAGNSFGLDTLNRYAMIELSTALALTIMTLAWGHYVL